MFAFCFTSAEIKKFSPGPHQYYMPPKFALIKRLAQHNAERNHKSINELYIHPDTK